MDSLKNNILKNLLASTYTQLALLSASFTLVYARTVKNLAWDWASDDNYSHGFLIPFIAAYMIYQKKDKLSGMPTRTSHWGILYILMGMFFLAVGNIGAELFVMRFSMLVTLWGLTLYSFGTGISRQVFIPIAYLIFMIPIPKIIWNQVAFPLQLFSAKLSGVFIQLIGIPVFRQGNILHLANTSLEVIDACSGLRSLTSLLALSGAFAYITSLKNISRWIIFLSGVPIAVAVNILRLNITAIMAHHIGPEAAQGFLHEMAGILNFVIALIIMYLLYLMIAKIESFLSK